MRHHVFGKKLNRDIKQRQALFKGLAISLIEKGSIKTTQAKAKAVKGWIDKLITKAKKETPDSYRQVWSKLGNKKAADKLCQNLAPFFKNRNSGYTRIVKLGNRLGDDALIVVIEWVEKPKVIEPDKSKSKKIEIKKEFVKK